MKNSANQLDGMSISRFCLGLLLMQLLACSSDSPPPDAKAGREAAAVRGEWFEHHYTYPTGRFDPAWMRRAADQIQLMPEALPLGRGAQPKLANGLPVDRFTPIGPAPLRSPQAEAGRINTVLVAPTPQIPGDAGSYQAFVTSAGGGIWKSDNCCDAQTRWRVVSDSSEVGTGAIGPIVFDPNDSRVIYAGTGDHRFGSFSFGAVGLLKSVDGGEHWTTLGADVFTLRYPVNETGFAQYQAISQIVVDPADSRRLLVGSKTGLFISHDAGASFTGPCLSNPHVSQRQDITGLLLLPGSGRARIVLAVGARGQATPVQPSLDNNGANGIYSAEMPTSGCPVDWQMLSGGSVFPAGMGNGRPLGPVGRIELAAAPSNPQVLYAELVAAQGFLVLGVWRSLDGGRSWSQRSPTTAFAGCRQPGSQNWYNAWIRVDPVDPEKVYLGALDIFRSLDGGISFQNLLCDQSLPPVHVDQHAFTFVGGRSSHALVGNDGGIYVTTNLDAPQPGFAPLNDSLNTIEFYAGDITANFALTETRGALGGAQDNGSSVLVQSGPIVASPWTKVGGGDGISARIEPVLGQRWYFGSQLGALVVSTNGPSGAEASAVGPWAGGSDASERKSFLMPIDLYKHGALDQPDSGCTATAGCVHMLAGTYRVWESVNGAIASTAALRWAPISPDLTRNNLITGTDNRSFINQLAYALNDRRFAMVATSDGKVWRGANLGNRPSTAAWVDLSADNRVLPNRSIMDVASDPANPDVIYAAVGGFGANTPATPGHVFQARCTADCSQFSWADKTGNLPDLPVNTIVINPWLPAQVIVGTDLGLFFTDNIESASPQWRRFAGFPRVMVWDSTVDRGFSTLAVFTRSRGAWVWPLPRVPTPPNLSGFWIDASQPGWGLSIGHQGSVLVPIWYTYEASGKPVWYLVSGASQQTDGSYIGPVFRFKGTPFDRISGPANQPGVEVGSARFSLDGNDVLSFSYTLNGISQTRRTTRFAAGPPPSCQFVEGSRAAVNNRSDLWWNPGQPGWGLQLVETGALIFAIWYSYGPDEQPMWVTALLARQPDGSFSGPLNRPLAGVPFDRITGPATSFPVPEVGRASLRFENGERGSFSTVLDGISQTRPIERIVFAGPGLSACE